jgi:hypothetical protein
VEKSSTIFPAMNLVAFVKMHSSINRNVASVNSSKPPLLAPLQIT